jgi:MYXO-CTERM domain-containing protein
MRSSKSMKRTPLPLKLTPALQLVSLCVLLSCQGPTPSGSEPSTWIPVGRTAEVTHDLLEPTHDEHRPTPPEDVALRKTAIEARRRMPSPESTLALAQAYFPEFAASATVSEPASDPLQRARNESHALTVTSTGDRALELTTRGLRFRIASRANNTGIRLDRAAALAGDSHFFAPTERLHGSDANVWKTSRVEEYWVRDTASGIHHAEYEVALPKEVTRLHDAGEYLEFLNAEGVPVLRFHPSVVRDAEGRTRLGTVELAGVERLVEHLYAVGERLHVAASVSLEGLTPPLVVDPGWSSASSMATRRYSHTATLLPSGKVLVTGGYGGGIHLATAELYDPATNTWSAAGSLATARSGHTATLLPSGKVLVTGGGNSIILNSAELYDPATNAWSAAASLATARAAHTATLLSSGKVLVAGGTGSTGYGITATAELYDPATNVWSTAGSLATARNYPTATLLPSGKVLVAGGYGASTSAELYDPGTNTWNAAADLVRARDYHTATLLPSGKVLVTGTYGSVVPTGAELYDPATNTWSTAASLATARAYPSATLLPSGKVLVVGGTGHGAPDGSPYSPPSTAELYDPATNTWSAGGSLGEDRYLHTATLLPSGKVLIISGRGFYGYPPTDELYDPGTSTWSTAENLSAARQDHTATLLPSGKVLVTGGFDGTGVLASAELYDPATNTWSAAGSLATARRSHKAILLPSGKVLVTSGSTSSGRTASVELYDPATNTWSAAGSLGSARTRPMATLLHSGKVLVVGGTGTIGVPYTSAELYDPETNTRSSAGSLASARIHPTATLLPSGKVLVTGGNGTGGVTFATAELYDPATNTWGEAGRLATARANHTATLLPSGKVLVTGGYYNGYLASVELYDPATNTWSAAGRLTMARRQHTATLLTSGKVLVTGGANLGYLATAEFYDPGTNTWSAAENLSAARQYHTATLLPSGKVLVTGGYNNSYIAAAELYDETGAQDAWRPVVAGTTSLNSGILATATGTGFRGISGGSSGATNDSPTDFPIVRLWSLANEQTWTLPGTAMSATNVSITPPDAPLGHYLLTVTVNGITGGKVVFLGPNDPPIISGTPTDSTVEATGPDGTVVSWTAPTADDDHDGPVAVTCAPASGSTFAIGTTTVTCTAADSSGKATSAAFTVTVSDTTPPAISVPADLSQEATGPAGAVVTYSITATDLVDGTTTVTCALASGTTFALGTSVVSCESTDSRGNRGVKTFNVTVSDTTAPTISCPSNLMLEATSEAGAVGTFTATATDAVTTAPTVSYSPASGATFALGTTTVTASATDAANNTSSCSFTVTVQDTTKPTITCASNVTVEATSSAGAIATYTPATSSDAASTPTITYSHTSGDSFALGTTTVTATATDAANNNTSCTFSVTVQDTTKPEVTCPESLVVEASDASGTIVSYSDATSTDAVTNPLMIVYSTSPRSLFPIGTTTVTASATDAANNTGSCTFTVKVQDSTPPTISCSSNVTAEATSAAGAIATYTTATSDDAVSTPTITYSHDSGSSFTLGETTVTATATDAAGNTETCTFKVLVHDTTAPVVTCPTTLNVEAVDSQGAPANWAPITAIDAVSPSPSVTVSHVSSSLFGLGETTVEVSATDSANNQSSCQFIVRVVDTTAPALICPESLMVEAADASGALVSYPDATATDAVTSPLTLSYSAITGATFTLGTTTVVASATDAANNTGTCSFTVTVLDTTAPQLECPVNIVEEATSSDGALVTYPAPVTSDLVSTPTVTLSPASMTQFALGDTTVEVSAEDAAGNATECSFTVKVQDSTPPLLMAPADLTVEATSAAGALVTYPLAIATDLVTASPTIVFEPASGTQLPLGTTTVTVTATDAAENMATETFRVTVADTTAPQLQCPANVEVPAENSNGATLTLPQPTVTDAVTPEPEVTFDQATAGVYPVGTTKVVATAKDAAGNSASCEFTVTVKAKETKTETPSSNIAISGCGCSSDSPASTVAGLVVLGLALARRRMRRSAAA